MLKAGILVAATVSLLLLTSWPIKARGKLPLPRFASVEAKPANVRQGPGIDYRVKWVFVKRWVPVEIFQEFGNWRRIRDWQGNVGWIFGPLLSTRRTALVAPWEEEMVVPLRAAADHDAKVIAWLTPKVMLDLHHCDGRWCSASVRSRSGFVRQERLWGAYPGETFD